MNRDGQAFLALMLLIGGVLTTTGVALALIVIGAINTSYGFQASTAAQAAATAAAEDVLLQLDRKSNLSSADTTGYSMGSGVGQSVTVTQNAPQSGQITVLSTATVSGRTRKIQVILSKNTVTGQTNVISWQNIP